MCNGAPFAAEMISVTRENQAWAASSEGQVLTNSDLPSLKQQQKPTKINSQSISLMCTNYLIIVFVRRHTSDLIRHILLLSFFILFHVDHVHSLFSIVYSRNSTRKHFAIVLTWTKTFDLITNMLHCSSHCSSMNLSTALFRCSCTHRIPQDN